MLHNLIIHFPFYFFFVPKYVLMSFSRTRYCLLSKIYLFFTFSPRNFVKVFRCLIASLVPLSTNIFRLNWHLRDCLSPRSTILLFADLTKKTSLVLLRKLVQRSVCHLIKMKLWCLEKRREFFSASRP